MPTIKLEISDKVEVCDAVSKFRKQCQSRKIDNLQQIVQAVEDIAYDLQRRGNELASLGSQFKTVKVLKTPKCDVRITASYGIPVGNSALALIRKLLRK